MEERTQRTLNILDRLIRAYPKMSPQERDDTEKTIVGFKDDVTQDIVELGSEIEDRKILLAKLTEAAQIYRRHDED